MSLAAAEGLTPSAACAVSARTARSAWLSRLAVYVGCTLLALVSNYLAGKETAWDTLNYHFYAGFSALHDRFDQDYFAAGAQGYFNPYAYVPFYALVKSGMPALGVASLLAIAHSVMLWLTYELGVLICAAPERRTQMLYGVCSALLAFLNPILIQQIGSSFADITTGTLVLAGWLLLARALTDADARTRWVLCAGLLLGAGCALKPTNTVHAVAASAMLLWLPRSLPAKMWEGARYGAALLLGFTLFAAPWSYHLERYFGNPFFPLLNNIFRSPDFTVESLRHFRFMPPTLAEALWRPFAMVQPGAMIHEELSAPDIRYAVLIALLTVLLGRWFWQRLQPAHPLPGPTGQSTKLRLFTALCGGLVLDWVLWLSASGNGRYFLPMGCVAAVVVVASVGLLGGRPKARNYLLAAILAVQGVQVAEGMDYRWKEGPWGGSWFNVEIPQRLMREPNLYLSIGVQSNSFLVPYFAPTSGLVSFSGGYALGMQGATGERIAALIRRHDPHLRMLASGARVYTDSESRLPSRALVDGTLQRLGLRLDPDDCATIAVHGVAPDLEFRLVAPNAAPVVPDGIYHAVTCRVLPAPAAQTELLAQQRAVDAIFDRLEDACPQIFRPRRMQTEHPGRVWLRNYLDTDVIAWVDRGQVKFRDLLRTGGTVEQLGSERDWEVRSQPILCGRHRDGSFFAHAVEQAAAKCAPESSACR